MRLRLVQRRTTWCLTWLGSLGIIGLFVIPVVWWWNWGESFLSLTQRLPAEVLVVEGWIGPDAVRAARAEFEQHGYQYVVATGGPASGDWDDDSSNYAEMAGRELIRLRVPEDRIIVAPAKDTETQRTYESAAAVGRLLQARGIHPKCLNVFTLGPHARRSRLVFAKVFGSETNVGVVGWRKPGYDSIPWWRSSERARELITETAGYLFEASFNSGRTSSSMRVPAPTGSPDIRATPLQSHDRLIPRLPPIRGQSPRLNYFY